MVSDYPIDDLDVTTDVQSWMQDGEIKSNKKKMPLAQLKIATVDMDRLFLVKHADGAEMTKEEKIESMDLIAKKVQELGESKGLHLVFDKSAKGTHREVIRLSPQSVDLTKDVLLSL